MFTGEDTDLLAICQPTITKVVQFYGSSSGYQIKINVKFCKSGINMCVNVMQIKQLLA